MFEMIDDVNENKYHELNEEIFNEIVRDKVKYMNKYEKGKNVEYLEYILKDKGLNPDYFDF